MIEIECASPEDILAMTGTSPGATSIGWIGWDGPAALGAGGLKWAFGRCWVWLDVPRNYRPPAVLVWRMAAKMKALARAIGDTEIWAARDATFPTSERLLTRLGFEKTDETFMENEVWRCRV